MKIKFLNITASSVLAVFCTAQTVFAQNKFLGAVISHARNIPHSAGLKSAVVKFTLVILALAVFFVIMYLGLALYNRFFVPKEIKDISLDSDSLRTPRDTQEAVNMFISKNRIK